jgi:hypothetical protein
MRTAVDYHCGAAIIRVSLMPAAPVSDSIPKFVTARQVRAAQVKFAGLWQERGTSRNSRQIPGATWVARIRGPRQQGGNLQGRWS